MTNLLISLAIIVITALGVIWMMLSISKEITKNHITLTFCTAISAVIIYVGFLFSTSFKSAIILSNIYYSLMLWMIFFLHQFIIDYSQIRRKNKYVHIFNILLCCLDSFYSIYNMFTGLFYSVVPQQLFATDLYIWTVQTAPLFIFHFINASIIIIQTFILLFVRITQVPNIYRTSYLRIAFCYVVFIIAYCFVNYYHFPIDISLFMFTFIADSLFLYASTDAPRNVINRTLDISNSNSKSGICCFTYENEIVFTNTAICDIFNITKKSEQSKIIEYYEDFIKRNNNPNQKIFTGEDEFFVNGSKRIFQVTVKKIIQQNTQVGTAIFLLDRTEELIRFKADKYKANHDELTGLYNREYFFERANECLRANPADKWLMLSSNIKDFKLINETQGEDFGDEVLRYIAKIIADNSHEDTIYGRISDDRFAILMKQEYFDEEKIQKEIANLAKITDVNGYKLQMNIGIFYTDYAMDNAMLMYDKADLAIQNQVNKYQQPFAEYTDSLMKKLIEEKNMLADFDYALRSGQFEMYLQPQISTNGKVKGAEALVRWNIPGLQTLNPVSFIPLFEKSGLIYKLDKFIWEEAAKKLYQWSKNEMKNQFISVNVSSRDFFYLDVHKEFVDLTKKYYIKPENLKIEITESVLTTNNKSALNAIQELRSEGFQIGIDNFGSKDSSLNMIKQVPSDVLKINMDFLQKNKNEQKESIILKNIVEMAKMLNMQVVIEKLENEEQFNKMKKIKCDLFQGFYYSKPLPVDEYEKKYFKEVE